LSLAGFSPRTREAVTAYIFLAPALVVFGLFVAYPLIDTIVISFQRIRRGVGEWIGLENYAEMLDDEAFRRSVENTAAFAVGMVPIGVLIALGLAALVSVIRSSRGQSFFKGAIYLPVVAASPVIFAVIWQYIYDPTFGVANGLLAAVGVEPQLWLNDPGMALPSMVLMLHTQWWGGMVLVVAAAIASVPTEVQDAAKVDGASAWTRFARITVPLIRPALAFVAIVGTISVLRLFDPVFLMTHGGPAFATITVAYDIYLTGITDFHFGEAAAYSVVLIVAAITVSVALYRSLNTNVEY
jgi:multiple sugar transport system permease protein